MKTIAIIDDDIHIGDMLTEVLVRETTAFCGHTPAQKLDIQYLNGRPIYAKIVKVLLKALRK